MANANTPHRHLHDPLFLHSEDRLIQASQRIKDSKTCNEKELPGLANLLDDYCNPDVPVSHESYLRRLLCVFKDSETDGTYSKILGKCSEDEKVRIRSFVDGEPAADAGQGFHMGISFGARQELGRLFPLSTSLFEHLTDDIRAVISRTFSSFHVHDDPDHKHRVDVYVDEEFQNWGRTVQNTPKFTCVPKTSYGVQQIVKYAKQHSMNVRAAGYRHSWSPVYGKNGQILISTLDLHRASVLPNVEALLPSWYPAGSGLSSIEFVGEPKPKQKRLVRVGTAATAQQFRVWCNGQKDATHLSTLPLNAILVETTFGGLNAVICHGAGRAHSTLSDLVYSLDYVDANGDLQHLDRSNPQFMNAASGCFGLLGIITHMTLEVDAMSYAVMTPKKVPLMQAIPPPPELDISRIPVPLRITMTDKERADAQAEFERQVRNDFYSEWFWFPYTSQAWINCWNTVDDPAGAIDYPSRLGVFTQFIQTIAIQIVQVSEAIINLEKLLPFVQTTLISKLGLDAMPTSPIKAKLPDALHFRRAVQNVRVRDMEIEIPLIPKTGTLADATFDSDIDYTNIQRAWWDAILTAYKHTETCPQRMPLEMRITGPSNVTMAPWRGHHLGSCSIEVLTLDVMKDVWDDYAQEILDHWMDLKDNQGQYLPSRPHWAKEWVQLKVRNRPMIEYVRESYKDSLVEFKATLQALVESKGGSLAETKQRFSNDLLDAVVWQQPGTSARGDATVVGGLTQPAKDKAPTSRVHEVKSGQHSQSV